MSLEDARKAEARAATASHIADLAQALHDRTTEMLAQPLAAAERTYFEELQSYLYAFRSVYDGAHTMARSDMEKALDEARKGQP